MPGFNPTPTHGRCRICRVIMTDGKHRHPPWQVLGWLWASSWVWKVYLLLAAFWISLAVGVNVVPFLREVVAGW